MTLSQLDVTHLSSPFAPQAQPSLTMSLSIGEHLAISGPSGCGKSSLLQVLAGLLPPETGSFSWQGRAVTIEQLRWWRTQCCYLPQAPVMGGETLLESLMLPWTMKATEQPKPQAKDYQTVLSAFGLEMAEGALVSTLSGGEKQRLAIARAVLMKRPIWLMDEPTSALDPTSRDLVANYLSALSIVQVSVSHDPKWLEKADKEFVMGGQTHE